MCVSYTFSLFSLSFSSSNQREAQRLQQHYYPLEVDHTISLQDKIRYMEEWVTKAHEALIKYGFRQSLLETAVKHSNLRLRDGIQEVFDLIHENEVPMLLFSAGIADIIEEVLRQQAKPPSQAHIVSNKMIFDEEGKLIDFTTPVFHVSMEWKCVVRGKGGKEEEESTHIHLLFFVCVMVIGIK